MPLEESSVTTVSAPTTDWSVDFGTRVSAVQAAIAANFASEPRSLAIMPVAPETPASYGAYVLRQLLAGGDLEIDPDRMAATIAALEGAMLAPAAPHTARPAGVRAAPRTSTGTKGRVGYGGRTAPETGPNGEKLRKLWTVKAPVGPFLIGCVTAKGGAAVWVVRDTRTNTDHAEPNFAYARVGEAVDHAERECASMPAEDRAAYESALLASGRIGTDKTAR
jgi:hypothetical protein